MEQNELDKKFSTLITKEEIEGHLKRMDSQSSPGHDGITIRAMKTTQCADCLAWLFSIFNKWNYLPETLKEARTSLIYKKGDKNDPSNWRPISVCSTLRRLYERIILSRMRTYTKVSEFQTGSQNIPGTFVNSSIINGCLNMAKEEKKDITVIFLDIAKAFDSIGHDHIFHTISCLPYPQPLRNIILNLTFGNFSRIKNNHELSERIYFKQGIFQGSVISPEIFNLCIDFMLKSLTEKEVSQTYGFYVEKDLTPISALGFVDDTCIIGKNNDAACELMSMAVELFNEIGLSVNIQKTQAICIKDGILCENTIATTDSNMITPVKSQERIKYLGVNFNNEIVFDSQEILQKVGKSIQILVSSPNLHPHQKITIINQFIWPTLIYPLQSAPLLKIPNTFLDNVDKLLRSSLREILCLPQDSPNAMLYSSSSCKGLNLINANWEACLQNHGICIKLLLSRNKYVLQLRKLSEEMEVAISRLQIPEEFYNITMNAPKPVSGINQDLRQFLRNQKFLEWSQLLVHGKGIETFAQSPKINRNLYNKIGLSTSEYISYFKMVSNTAPVRALHGRSQGRHHCRRCNENTETLAHVLGFCPYGMLLRNDRHHKIRIKIADAFRKKNFEVYEELPTLDRRIDIIAIDRVTKRAFILDPTIRSEQSLAQTQDVDQEKKSIYEPCIEDLRSKCNLDPNYSITVHGLLIGARGSIHHDIFKFFKTLKIPKSTLEDIAISAVKGSCRILHNHLYSPLNC